MMSRMQRFRIFFKDKSHQNWIKSLILFGILFFSIDSCMNILDALGMMGEPYDWGNRLLIPAKVNQARDLFLQNPGKFRIVHIGDSRGETNLDPFYVDEYFSNTTITYNLAISGTENQFQSLYIKHVIIPRLHPNLIIWDVNNVDFDNDVEELRQRTEMYT
ncbi:MAG: hypothetical protein RBG13Loki_3314 [Promethearchaeota archaeon CR_4]|nr:MAG: hypothetical protein RBG13Loki_3314 [Candidatus Lokiarchaeota archaeon CR_4]